MQVPSRATVTQWHIEDGHTGIPDLRPAPAPIAVPMVMRGQRPPRALAAKRSVEVQRVIRDLGPAPAPMAIPMVSPGHCPRHAVEPEARSRWDP